MYPVHDVDAVLLLSLSVAAKRRPADLIEIVTAIDLAHGTIPSEHKLSDAFARLSAYGLIAEIDGGYTLPPVAQAMMESQRKNDDTAKKMVRLKEHLADYRTKEEHATVQVNAEQLLAAIQAYRKERASNRSWLIEKPKPVWIPKKELVRGKSLPASKRRKS